MEKPFSSKTHNKAEITGVTIQYKAQSTNATIPDNEFGIFLDIADFELIKKAIKDIEAHINLKNMGV